VATTSVSGVPSRSSSSRRGYGLVVTMERPARFAYHVGCPRVWAEAHTEGAGRVQQEVCLS
jgi:hypothetical protein